MTGHAFCHRLLTPTHEAALKITIACCLIFAAAMLALVLYQAKVIAQQKEALDWVERTFFSRRV